MSSKLQTKIQEMDLPGKHKRVLLALASFAHNDGTNIWSSKETIAKRASVNRATVYRNMEELVETGILKEAKSHTCGREECGGGPKHFTGGNTFTVAYDIDLEALQIVTEYNKLQRSKMRKVKRRILQHPSVAKCDANLSYESVPPESSVVNDGIERESEGSGVSLRSTPISSNSRTPAPTMGVSVSVSWHPEAKTLSDLWLKRTGKPFTSEEYGLATSLIAREGHHVVEPVLDITLNRREKSAKMLWGMIGFDVFVAYWTLNYHLAKAYHAVATAKREYPREIPPKFKVVLENDDGVEHRATFAERCKSGDWTIKPSEWKETGADEAHFAATVRFCVENRRRVTKTEFVELLYECMAVINLEPVPGGQGFEVEES
jgi:hypothetical protein